MIKNEYQWYKNLLLMTLTKNDIRCKLPKDIRLSHGCLGTVIGKKVKFGKNCTLRSCTNIGTPVKYKNNNWVIIGDNVNIGIKVSIMNLTKHDMYIGDNVTIGAGSIVFSDVPPNTFVKGKWDKRKEVKK